MASLAAVRAQMGSEITDGFGLRYAVNAPWSLALAQVPHVLSRSSPRYRGADYGALPPGLADLREHT